MSKQKIQLMSMRNATTPRWKKWKYQDDCTAKELKEANLRGLYDDEIVLDCDKGKKHANDVVKSLKKEHYTFQFWNTGSKGYHIHLRVQGLETLSEEDRNQYRLEIIKKYKCDEAKKTGLIALEKKPHFKTGIEKKLIKKVGTRPNTIDYAIYTSVKNKQLPKTNQTVDEQNDVTAVKKKVRIRTVVESYGGKINARGFSLCVLHNEKTPSMYINESQDLFYCFGSGCNKGGDVFNLVQFHDNVNFQTALRKLAGIARVKISGRSQKTIILKNKPVRISPKWNTRHLPNFGILERIYALRGTDYTPHIISEYYSLMGLSNTKKTIRQGDVFTDTRINVLHPLRSGGGKKNIQHGNRLIVDKLGLKFVSPSSLHEEQLVGKVIQRGKGKSAVWVKNPGHFASDYLSFDEMFQLFSGKDERQQAVRKYLREAQDPYGRNFITKRTVDNLDTEEEQLKYKPHFISNGFLQPFPFPEFTVTEGNLRRYIVPYTVLPITDEDNYSKRLRESRHSEKSVDTFADFIFSQGKKLLGKDFSFTEDALGEFERLHLALVHQGYEHSEKGENYTKMLDYALQDRLLKFVCLLATAHGTSNIDANCVRIAYLDLAAIWHCELQFVLEKVQGSLDYGETWKAQDVKEASVFKWLYEEGGANENDSIVTITDFQEAISEIFNVKTRMAQYRMQDFIKRGLIGSKQVGSKDSRVWLCFDPVSSRNTQGVQKCKGCNTYKEVLSSYTDIVENFTGLKESEIVTKIHSGRVAPLAPLASLKVEKKNKKAPLIPTTQEFESIPCMHSKCNRVPVYPISRDGNRKYCDNHWRLYEEIPSQSNEKK